MISRKVGMEMVEFRGRGRCEGGSWSLAQHEQKDKGARKKPNAETPE